MATVGSVLTNEGKKIILDRAYLSTPTYTSPTRFKVGVNSIAPDIADTDLDNPVPISNGTIYDDGSLSLIGKFGGTATTDNASTYKDGAGTTDATSQNLITNTTSGSKTWFLSSGSLNADISGTNKAAIWLYIINATAKAKFKTSGTAVEVRFGSGTQDNYYKKGWTASQLKTGWNFLHSGTVVNALNSTGTPTDPMNSFLLQILTNNDSDTFSSGDIIYDLARGWDEANELKNWTSGYPTINESAFTVEMRGKLETTDANGFDLDSFGDFNSGTMMAGKDVFTSESKSNTDAFIFVLQDRLN